MSTFAQLAAKNGVGVAYYFAVSLDHGSTISYYYSTHEIPLVSDPVKSSARVVKISPLARGFSPEHGFQATAFDVDLDNTDQALDWISDRITFASQALRSTWLFVMYLYDPQNPADYSTKTLGTFMLMDPPKRDAGSIKITLVDNVLGDVQLAAVPTIRDLLTSGDASLPASIVPVAGADIDRSVYHVPQGLDIDVPLPLMFGSNAFPITRIADGYFAICAVAGTRAGLPETVSYFVLNGGFPLPTTIQNIARGGATANTYTVHRSPDLTKNGKTWHVLWASFNLTPWSTFDVPAFLAGARDANGALYDFSDRQKLDYDFGIYDLVGPITVRDPLLSHHVNDITGLVQGINALVVMKELVEYYTKHAITTDATSFSSLATLKAEARASGLIQPGVKLSNGRYGSKFRELIDGDLIKALRDICQMAGVDLYFSWDGVLFATAAVADYTSQTATLSSLDEAECAKFEERIPGAGERGEPFNRLFVTIQGIRWGPVDDAAAITAWDKTVDREISTEWFAFGTFGKTDSIVADLRPDIGLRYANSGGSTVRPRVRVRTSLRAVLFDLGQYITFSWTRGGVGSPYSNAVFRIEEMRFYPMEAAFDLDLMWVDDLRSATNAPYILDDETLLTRATGSGGRTATLTTGSNTVAFSSGNLVSDGAAAGDHLIVTDATETANSFARNVALYVASVTDATHLVISGTYSSNAFGGGGPFVLSTWELRRGALNYRSNAAAYGKVGDSTHAGKFSDNTTNAYKVLDG